MEVRNNVSFGANYISPAKIRIKNGKKWKDVELSFIKFNTSNKTDLETIRTVAKIWGRQNLSAGIQEEAEILGKGAQIYAVTAQRTGFEHAVAHSIMGLMSTDKIGKAKETVQIFKIGTAPQFAYEQNGRSRELKHIARGMIDAFRDFVKSKNKGDVVVSYADSEDIKFLNKVGLRPKNDLTELINNKQTIENK